jgi:dipeptidase E
MPYIGSSAGSNVAAPTITDDKRTCRLSNRLLLLRWVSWIYQINPHYLDPDPASKHMGETREERLRQFSKIMKRLLSD